MAIKTYGHIFIQKTGEIVIDKAEPHVCIRLKHIFPKIHKADVLPFTFNYTPENGHDLLWFMDRYPLEISKTDRDMLRSASKAYTTKLNEIESIFLPDYVPHDIQLNEGKVARHYQLVARDYYGKVNKFLLGDDLGLGKTVSAIISLMDPAMLPAVVICPSHLIIHWKEKIAEFTNLTTHVVKQGSPYDLPKADVYISRYNFLYKWVDVTNKRPFKQAILDEVQDLRHDGTNKYYGGRRLAESVDKLMALSATPIYNYGNEIFNIMQIVRPGVLGTWGEFTREWCSNGKKVDNPQALGTYLREANVLLRRSRKDVGKELPPINKVIYTVEHDYDQVRDAERLAIQLAIRTTTGTFMERGQAAMELDVFLRKLTGVSKAKFVADFVKILLDNGEPVVLAGWHRDVYEIWAEQLAEYKPVFYTGSESPKQKNDAKQAFVNGETSLFIISLRSGVGLDGLQYRAKTVVYGELDYSPKVHDQLTGRVDRDGQEEQVTAVYLVSEWGSDPVLIDMLGLKASQSEGIMNPDGELFENVSDESRIQQMAKKYLDMQKVEHA